MYTYTFIVIVCYSSNGKHINMACIYWFSEIVRTMLCAQNLSERNPCGSLTLNCDRFPSFPERLEGYQKMISNDHM